MSCRCAKPEFAPRRRREHWDEQTEKMRCGGGLEELIFRGAMPQFSAAPLRFSELFACPSCTWPFASSRETRPSAFALVVINHAQGRTATLIRRWPTLPVGKFSVVVQGCSASLWRNPCLSTKIKFLSSVYLVSGPIKANVVRLRPYGSFFFTFSRFWAIKPNRRFLTKGRTEFGQ